MDLATLGTYGSFIEASLVRAKLETFGIEAIVESDLATSSIPTFDQMHGVKVLVKEGDLAEAYEVLERMLPAGSD